MIRETFPVGPLGCNCTIVGDPSTGEAIVVDPGGDAPIIQAVLQRHKLTKVTAVVHTHAHIDHVGATQEICAHYGCKPYLHDADAPLYQALPIQAQMLGIELPESVTMEPLVDNSSHRAGAVEVGVMHTPGHTFGSCCFLLEKAGVLLSGDTLFRRGIGRTDIGGDYPTLIQTIRDRLFALHGDVVVVPGHGPTTTVAEEKRFNPFLT